MTFGSGDVANVGMCGHITTPLYGRSDVKLSDYASYELGNIKEVPDHVEAYIVSHIIQLEARNKTLSKVLIEDHDWTQEQIDYLLSPNED